MSRNIFFSFFSVLQKSTKNVLLTLGRLGKVAPPPPPFLLHYWGGVNKLALSSEISLPPVRFLVSFWDNHPGKEWGSHIYRWWVWIVIGYYVKNSTRTCKRQKWNHRKLHFRLSLTMSGNLTLTFVQEPQPHPQASKRNSSIWRKSNPQPGPDIP